MKNLLRALMVVGGFFLLGAQGGCDQPTPPQRTSQLTINIQSSGASDFTFVMHSDAISEGDAIRKAINALQDSLDKRQVEKPVAKN